MEQYFSRIIAFIREAFDQPEGFIPLHAPYFGGNERRYVLDTLDSTFVSSVGAYVNRFEDMMAEITGARYAIATTNGTTALHLALLCAGVQPGELVITQPLTFVATANAIAHAGAMPAFVDVDADTMGLSPDALQEFLEHQCRVNEAGICIHQETGSRIAACVPMHTFGFPCRIDRIAEICNRYGIALVEDAAESLGSWYQGRHTGTFGLMGTFSFNGNKTVTCGGGGAIITNDEAIARRAKHLSTTAKVSHSWAFMHDETGYNYRLPNLNAALACAQLEQLDAILSNKRELADSYGRFFEAEGIPFVREIDGGRANYWLNTMLLPGAGQKDAFLAYANERQVMVRPVWQLMQELPMYRSCPAGDLSRAKSLEARIVNIPSSYRTVLQTTAL
jgi:perosamine synthetase